MYTTPSVLIRINRSLKWDPQIRYIPRHRIFDIDFVSIGVNIYVCRVKNCYFSYALYFGLAYIMYTDALTFVFSNRLYTCQKYSVNNAGGIGWPFNRMRSLTWTKWGELKKPVRTLRFCRIASTMAHVEPYAINNIIKSFILPLQHCSEWFSYLPFGASHMNHW